MRIILAVIVAAIIGCVCYSAGHSRGYAQANQEFPECGPCWGDVLMEDYLLDVIDETDFWEECDSTAFSCYEYLTSEWYLAVICEYAKWDASEHRAMYFTPIEWPEGGVVPDAGEWSALWGASDTTGFYYYDKTRDEWYLAIFTEYSKLY